VDVELSAASKIWVESKPINIPSISHKFHAHFMHQLSFEIHFSS
jgi:hypothetical protein